MGSFADVTPVAAAFLASSVEAVEALTIVLAVSVVRGPRPALLGAVAALSLLGLLVAIFGPLIQRIPIHGLQVVVGILLLLFGLGWLRKAILRAGGALPLHDEAHAFAAAKRRYQDASADKAADWIGGPAAFKAVLLEGTEVVFIVLAVAVRPGMLTPAAVGAASACMLVAILGLALRAPLARIPENSLKFAVGSLLSGFGLFWTAEGLRTPLSLRRPGDSRADQPVSPLRLRARHERSSSGREISGMDVIRDFLATIWKMFAGDLPLSIGALSVVAAATVSVRLGILPVVGAPILSAIAILIVLAAAVVLSVNRGIKGRTKG